MSIAQKCTSTRARQPLLIIFAPLSPKSATGFLSLLYFNFLQEGTPRFQDSINDARPKPEGCVFAPSPRKRWRCSGVSTPWRLPAGTRWILARFWTPGVPLGLPSLVMRRWCIVIGRLGFRWESRTSLPMMGPHQHWQWNPQSKEGE